MRGSERQNIQFRILNNHISYACPLTDEMETLKDFSFEVHHSLSEINSYQWDNHIPERNLLMKFDYLQLLEETQRDKMQFRYVQVRRNGATVGTIYLQIVDFRSHQLINYYPSGDSFLLNVGRKISEQLLSRLHLKMLVSGNIFMTGENGYYFSSDIDKATRAKLLRTAIRNILKDEPSVKAVLISDLYAPATDFDLDFKRFGYNTIFVESDMSIPLREEWKTFDDYLHSLTSKYRIRARKVDVLCRQNEVFGRELNLAEIVENEDRLYELYMKVMSNVDFRLGELTKDYFRKQKEQLPDNYKIVAYYKGDLMIGFISHFHSGKKIEVHYTGMDHEVCRPIHLYQHMMYDMIEYGILHRAERLHLGRTAPEIKSTIGAKPSPMYGYLKHRNPLFNYFIMKPYAKRLKPPAYILRHPFK